MLWFSEKQQNTTTVIFKKTKHFSNKQVYFLVLSFDELYYRILVIKLDLKNLLANYVLMQSFVANVCEVYIDGYAITIYNFINVNLTNAT